MKTITSLFLMLSLALTVSCGNDKKGGKDNNGVYYDLLSNPNQQPVPQQMNGLYNPQSGTIEVAKLSFTPNQIFAGGQTYPQQTMQYPQQYPQQYPTQQYQGGMYYNPCMSLVPNSGFQLLNLLQQSLQNPALRPAYLANGIVKFNVRMTGYAARCQQGNVLILTGAPQAF